jgi:hypothetical protein
MKHYLILVIFSVFSANTLSDTTKLAKVISTEGHSSPSCRTLTIKENTSGLTKRFRIQDIEGDDDVSSVALAALVSGRNIKVNFNPDYKSGCGNEPRVGYITIY